MNSDGEYTACDEERPLSQQELRDILDDQLEWEYDNRWRDYGDDHESPTWWELGVDDPNYQELLTRWQWIQWKWSNFRWWLRELPSTILWKIEQRIWKDDYFRDWMRTDLPDDIPF